MHYCGVVLFSFDKNIIPIRQFLSMTFTSLAIKNKQNQVVNKKKTEKSLSTNCNYIHKLQLKYLLKKGQVVTTKNLRNIKCDKSKNKCVFMLILKCEKIDQFIDMLVCLNIGFMGGILGVS